MSDVGISLGIDAKELYQELQNVTAKFVEFSGQTTQAGEKAGQGFAGGFKSNLTGLGGNIAGTLAGLGLGAAAKDIIEYGAHIQDLSERFGVGAVTLQKFGNAAEKNGSSLEGVAKAFRFLEVNQSKALGGNEAMITSFAALGISVEDLKTLSPDQLMLKLGASSLNAADVVKVLGKSAIELRTTLGGLADGTIEFGQAINAIQIQKLKEADDQMKTLGETLKVGGAAALTGFVGLWQHGIQSIVLLLEGLNVALQGSLSAADKLVHGDFKGAKREVTAGREEAAGLIKESFTSFGKTDLLFDQEDRKRRDFSHPEDADTGAGETDDEGRSTGKRSAADRGADREAGQLEREQEKLAKTEEERRLAQLSFEERQAQQRSKAAGLLGGSEASYPELGSGEELKKVQLKNEYYELVKQIEADEKKHAEEMERSEKNRARELKKEKVSDTLGTGRGENETGNEFLKRTGRIDAHARPATLREGLETGHVQAGSLIGDRSTADFHADFSKHVDLGPQHLSIADKLKQSGASLGKDADKSGGAGDKLSVSADKLSAAAKEIHDALRI